ncbi:berberine bridge enzyme-like 17 [Mercurialis annua]|uniref:berberine bridge enzyme-like 17 n=1 Tax=Mercurialis annua TaxID=3986 RepID=UPI0024ADA4E3|nr:berberine bridge enzyme-like 17 [Mercurialis annua]
MNPLSKMKVILILFSIVLFPLLVQSSQVLDNFLQCLPNHTNHSNPISQAIYTPQNTTFNHVLNAYIRNLRFINPATPKPLAIITANDESHVQATVICAKSNGLQIRIRSGGHDYEGLSYVSTVPFVILDMFNLRSIDIDIGNETAWVQTGATLGELYYNIANVSKIHAFPGGVCPTVGVGGHFSGGGYGNMLRKFGLTVDNIVDARLVDANGNLLDRESMGEDLFWAIRGGGGGSFGVIISWKIKLVQVPPVVTVFLVNRTVDEGATDVVYRWLQVASELDNELFIRIKFHAENSSVRHDRTTIKAAFYGLFLGQTNNLISLMNLKFPELGLHEKDCNESSWVESTLFWADFPAGTPTEALLNRTLQTQVFFKSRSDYVKKIIPKQNLEQIWKMLAKVENMYMQWNPYGGKMSEISESETPFPHRKGYLFKIQYYTAWSDQEEGNFGSNYYINLSRKMYKGMASYVSKDPREAFLNYRDLDIGSNPSNDTNFQEAQVYGGKYFKNNFLRLTSVKKRVDPDNFFKNEQSIPPLP